MSKGIGGHQRAYEGKSNEWLTPPEVLKALGPFDLDPCAPVVRPWDTATTHYTISEDGLSQPWYGRVWMNPPYGPHTAKWLARLREHGNGIALIFARTETAMFVSEVWPYASGLLFLAGRLHFHRVDGVRAEYNAGGPSVLVAYGSECSQVLRECSLKGGFVSGVGVKM